LQFDWQKGDGAFTHSHSQLDLMLKYILISGSASLKNPFKEEYFEKLEKNNVEFKEE